MRKIKCFNVTLICPDNTDEGTEYIFVSNASCILKKEGKKKPEQVCLFGTRQVAGCLCSFKRNLIWRSDNRGADLLPRSAFFPLGFHGCIQSSASTMFMQYVMFMQWLPTCAIAFMHANAQG